MSENKKEKKLPGKDYFHSYKADASKKRKASKLTEKEKEEFAEAFDASKQEEDVKAYVPGENKAEKASDAGKAEADENMYVLPQFDEQEVYATLGIKLPEKLKEPEETKKSEETSEQLDKTMAFSRAQVNKELEQGGKKKLSEEALGNTRYFSLRTKNKRAEDKNKKNLMQNFRVLSKNREDSAILEVAPTGNGGKGLADSVKAKEGEDVFEAVEKAYEKKREQQSSEKKSSGKERRLQGEKKGEQQLSQITKQLKSIERSMIVYGVLFAAGLLAALFCGNTRLYPAISLFISLVACVMSFPVFEKSFRAIKGFSAVSDTALSVMSFFVLLHNVCVVLLKQNVGVYTLCLIFALFMRGVSEHFRLKGRERLVAMALKSRNLSTLQRIPVKKDASSFTKNTVKGEEPDIFYCTRAMLDTSIEEPSGENLRESKYYIFAMSFVLLAGIVVGLFSFTIQLTGLSFVTALTATVCILLPLMYDPLSRIIFYRNGSRMLNHGACISGREALTHIGRSDGFVLDASDVFAGEVSRFRKSAVSKMDQNDSAVFAALLIKEAGSVLAPCFDSFLEQMNIVLPPVENFLYEERLGYSAWVLDRKVLVGNRQMLLNHSISVPSKEQEKAYAKGRHVMYVVIDGEITATFLVGYKVISSLKRYSRDFNKTGLVLMLSSKEVFLNEEAVAAKLSIDASSVKVLSSKAAAIMDKYNDKYEKQSPTGLLCSGKRQSIMHLIMGCYNANASDRLILIMMLLGQLLGFLVLVLSAVLNMKLFFNPLAIVAIRLLWSFVIKLVIERKK